jgi:xanthine dehydrogenase accessory factor
VAILKRNLAAEGFTAEDLDRLHAPVGLDIGADNPGEIAVSIVAELIAVRRRGSHAGSLSRARPTPRGGGS